MNTTSQWPLTKEAIRYTTPEFMLRFLQKNPLTRACYPCAVGYYPKALGHKMTRIKHKDNLLIYCTDGEGFVRTKYFNGKIETGDLLLLPKDCLHEYFSSTDKPWSIHWLHFSGLESAALLKSLEYSSHNPVVHIGKQPILLADLKRLQSLRKSGYQYAVFTYAASLTRQILCQLALSVRNTTAMSRHNFNLDEIQSFMMEHLESHIDLDMLANCANLSKFHFASKYKQLTGYPPIKHFIHMKIEHGCYLLDNTDMPIGKIALQLGYEDKLYFSRIFKKITGTPPSHYRKQRT